ncbi:MAG: hypothetical protein WBL28_00030 [Methylotenera sp.]
MIQINIKTKSDLINAIKTITIKKIYVKEITNKLDLADFINEIKATMNTTGTLTLVAIKE